MQTNSSNSLMSPLNCKGIILEWMLQAFHSESSRINSAGLSDKDWVLLIDKAQKTGLNSRLIEMLNTSNHSVNIPLQILSSLTTARILAIQRNLMLLDEYHIISEEFRKNKLPHQAIKGLWILQHPELLGMSRITSDIDLLIPPENIGQAIDIIRMLGYQQNPIRSRFDSAPNFKSGHHLIPFRKNDISVEIHYRALPGSSETFNCELIHMSRLRDHFSVILLHFIRHNITGDPQLKWLVDMLRLFQYLKPEDLPFINSTIQNDQHSEAALKLMQILSSWHNSKTPSDKTGVLSYLLKESNNKPNQSLKDFAKKIPKGMAGIRFICATVFPRREYLRFIYPSKQNYPGLLLYPFRWYQLGRKLRLISISVMPNDFVIKQTISKNLPATNIMND